MSYKIKNIREQKGFTIVEALIVLAVTGMLFVSTSLLIRGQIEKVRYQDSMRQLQQMVQNTIDDVENGYFPSSGNGDSTNIVIAGKRLSFCKNVIYDNSMTPRPGYVADASYRQPCDKGNNIMRVENIVIDRSNPAATFESDVEIGNNNEQYLSLPGGLEYTKFYTYSPGGSQSEWPTGFSLILNGLNNGTDNGQQVALRNYYIDNNPINSPDDFWVGYYRDNGLKLCFEGYKKGSLVIGKGSGLTVDMILEDPACQ